MKKLRNPIYKIVIPVVYDQNLGRRVCGKPWIWIPRFQNLISRCLILKPWSKIMISWLY